MAVDINELQRRLHERILPLAAREAEDLKAALGAVDDISLPLLRFHLLAEQMLERIISGVLKRPDRILDEGRLTFAQKLSLVHAFDVVDDAAISALRRVNALRNECAHVKGKQISESDIDRIGQPLGKDYQDIKRANSRHLKQLLIFTLARVAQPFIAAVLTPDAKAHLITELDSVMPLTDS
ncbi:MAG: hypothetical protein DMF87_24740 [Acidobacteria bacterium]|nr:MAG: hypothetical protein DMF87_24740 [Acidobacteriota bacterium]